MRYSEQILENSFETIISSSTFSLISLLELFAIIAIGYTCSKNLNDMVKRREEWLFSLYVQFYLFDVANHQAQSIKIIFKWACLSYTVDYYTVIWLLKNWQRYVRIVIYYLVIDYTTVSTSYVKNSNQSHWSRLWNNCKFMNGITQNGTIIERDLEFEGLEDADGESSCKIEFGDYDRGTIAIVVQCINQRDVLECIIDSHRLFYLISMTAVFRH